MAYVLCVFWSCTLAATLNLDEACRAIRETPSNAEAARQLGRTRTSFLSAFAGVAAEFVRSGGDLESQAAVPMHDTSTLYDRHGNPTLQWVKAKASAEQRQKAMRQFVRELCETVTPRKPVKLPKQTDDNLCVVYPIGDHHLGMYADEAETGAGYNLKTAGDLLATAVDHLVTSSPKAGHAVLANLGDFLHCDDSTNRTRKSGHQLDVSGRFHEAQRLGTQALVRAVDRLLERHKTVHAVNCRGNHDGDSAGWLSQVLNAWFRNEPRVTVDMTPAHFLHYRYGRNMLSFTHGDTIKFGDVAQVMASNQAQMWGETKYRMAFTGHVHHRQQLAAKEQHGAFVESFGVLPPSDAYAASLGYNSAREMHALTFVRSGGLLSRQTFNAGLMA